MIRIAAVQMRVVDDVEKNKKTILKYLKSAKIKKANIVCFPEACLSNWEKEIKDVSKQLKDIQESVKRLKLYVIVSSYVVVNKKKFNRTFFIGKDGKIKAHYDKVHLFRTERSCIHPGKKQVLVKTEFGKIGLVTCWDYAFPNYIQRLSKAGAKIIFCPSYILSHNKTFNVLPHIAQVRAFENMNYFVWVDAYTSETFKQSRICGPLDTLTEIKNKPGMILADLNLKKIDKLKKYFRLPL